MGIWFLWGSGFYGILKRKIIFCQQDEKLFAHEQSLFGVVPD